MYKRTQLALAGLVLSLSGVVGAASRDLASTVDLTIGSQFLSSALLEFSAQTGMQVVTSGADVRNLKTSGVTGKITVRQALEKLLSGSGLSFKLISDNTIGLVRKGGDGNPTQGDSAAPVDQMRLAATEAAGTAVAPQAVADSQEGRDQVTVEGRREPRKPFTDGNADIARTINDQQPYYIFDAKTIEESGTLNIEEFLKQRLTMNAVAQTNAEISGFSARGNTSSVNLRGLGTDKTLILVNGRRLAGVAHEFADTQPDLNGIALGAIERIEVLPSSASGIYGGSAVGGVVNVILKRDYAGGEARLNYDNTADGDAPGRSASASYGVSLEDGRTQLNFSATWSDKGSLLLQDRADIFRANVEAIRGRAPATFYSSTNPWLGALPNISPTSSSVTTLTLKPQYGGTVLNSRNTYIPAGTSASVTAAQLGAGLTANAGRWDFDFPLSTQSPTGLLRPLGQAIEARSFRTGLRRQMLSRLDLTADFSWSENQADSIYSQVGNLRVPGGTAGAPTNPFTTDVYVQVPDATQSPGVSRSLNRSLTVGALAQLPWDWTGALDYTWSESRFESLVHALDFTALNTAVATGALNPFVDTLRHRLDFSQYLSSQAYRSESRMQEAALRGSGPLLTLPWGKPSLTIGLGHRITRTPEKQSGLTFPVTVTNNYVTKYYAWEAATDSGYLEATVPLVKAAWLPALYSLDLQFSGRRERYQVDTGTNSQTTYYNRTPPLVFYGGPSLNNQAPYFSQASYTSSNYTVGLKYQPVRDVTLRASQATAFIPPTPLQLVTNPLQSTFTTPVNDPRFGDPNDPANDTNVYTLGGGNAGLKPQNSKSFNAGAIWEPNWKPLSGLRLNAEYYRIEQFDAIGSLDAQAIVNLESVYPGRITRDANGRITLVDTSMLNLYHRETEGWDLSLDYTRVTRAGRFSLHAAESIVLHLKNQYAQTQPEYDAVDFPSEAGAVRYKTTATVNWEAGPLTLGWTARYLGAYKQYGAAGGPDAAQRAATGTTPASRLPQTMYTLPQGGDAIPSQIYHDLVIGYSFARSSGSGAAAGGRLLDGLSLQLGVRNVFDKVPPLDAYYYSNYYVSPYGDLRLRSYWLSARMSL